ncbi:MAG: hypothetical protein ACPF9D_05160, partial [Owenweeksia sp.]
GANEGLLTMIGIDGKVVYREEITLGSGANELQVDVSRLGRQLYQVVLTIGDNTVLVTELLR